MIGIDTKKNPVANGSFQLSFRPRGIRSEEVEVAESFHAAAVSRIRDLAPVVKLEDVANRPNERDLKSHILVCSVSCCWTVSHNRCITLHVGVGGVVTRSAL